MTSTTNNPLVLVIEDESPIRRFLRATLSANGFQVNEAETAKDGIVQAGMRPPDLIILDLGLPDVDGLEVTRQIRQWSKVPIIVLSAREQENDKVAALDAGADDYLTKPFAVGELMARLRVAMRHASTSSGADKDAVFKVGDLEIDLSRRVVTLQRNEVRLTPIEYRLLTTLVKHAGKVLTHQFLLKEVWGPSHVHDTPYLRVYMGQLRQKLEADSAQPRYLLTESGVGYRLLDR